MLNELFLSYVFILLKKLYVSLFDVLPYLGSVEALSGHEPGLVADGLDDLPLHLGRNPDGTGGVGGDIPVQYLRISKAR